MCQVVSSGRRRLVVAISLCAASVATIGVQAAELTFMLPIAGGRLPENMQLVRVKQGDVVTLRWSTDRSLLLHLHGYDIERRVEPGTVVEMRFTARATGRFPVHVHSIDARSGSHAREEAPLVYVEVYPP